MKKSLHHFLTFFIIITILITAIVLPSFASDLNPYILSTNLSQIMGVRDFYYCYHSYSDSNGSLLFSGHKGIDFNILQFVEGSYDSGYEMFYSNYSDYLYLTRWESLDNYAYIEYKIPLSFGDFVHDSDDFSFDAQFVFNVDAAFDHDENRYLLMDGFSVDSVFFKGTKRTDNQINASYEWNLAFNELPSYCFTSNPYRPFKLVNISGSFTPSDIPYLTNYIDMDYLYIRVKRPMETVFSDVNSTYGFTRLSLRTTESNFQNIIGNINTLQLKIDTLIAVVNDNFAKLMELMSSAQTSDQLQQIQKTIDEVNGEWTHTDDQIYDEYVESTQQTTDRLEEMGDALQNVVKPPTSNITNIIKPSTVIKDVNINDAKTFLSIIYDWETFLYIIGIVVALMTASYIIFGKKE